PPTPGGAGRADRWTRCTSRGVDGRPRGPRGPGCWRRCSRPPRPSPCGRWRPGRSLSRPAADRRRPSRSPSDEALVEPSELFVAVVLDHDSPAVPRTAEADLRPEAFAEVRLHALEIGVEPIR